MAGPMSSIFWSSRHSVSLGRKHLCLNSVKNLCCVAAFKGDISAKILSKKTSQVMDQRTSRLTRNNGFILLNVPYRNKGHSHWQNIQRVKTSAEAEKMKKITQYIGLLKGAISSHGPNPETNKSLAKILDKMKATGLPAADVKRYFENATKKASSTTTSYFEVRGPRGSLFVLEVETDNIKSSKDKLNSLTKKILCQVADHPTYKMFFDVKGTVEVPITKDMQTSNMDEYLEIAIESGAEDVILTRGDEDDVNSEMVLKFHCDPLTLASVTREIEETYDLEVSSSKVELHPHTWVTIDQPEDLEICQQIAEKIRQHPEVVEVYDNINVPEE